VVKFTAECDCERLFLKMSQYFGEDIVKIGPMFHGVLLLYCILAKCPNTARVVHVVTVT